jgi:DNA-binding NarL/FixJ family response regulator
MINIAIIEDNPQYRQTLSIIMQLNEELRLMHKMGNCAEMEEAFMDQLPEVVMMDIDLPGMSGIEGVKKIRNQWPQLKVLMLTVFEDPDKIFSAIKAGANGYLLKKDSPTKIIESIFAVQKGEAPMNGLIASKLLEYFQQQEQPYTELDKLSEREKSLLELLVQGFSYKQIASQSDISVETLNSHFKNIYRKLDVHSRAEVAARYGNIFNVGKVSNG